MENKHTPEQVATTIKKIIKQKYGNLVAYAEKKKITSTHLYNILNGKDYLDMFNALRFIVDFDITMDYCTDGTLPILSPDHDYNLLLEAATGFFFAVMKEDKVREEYERKYDELSEDERLQYKRAIEKLRIEKAKEGCDLVDLLNTGWKEENPDEVIEKPIIPKSTMKLHEAIQEVIRQSGRPLTFTEIAKLINQDSLYSRKDGQPVPASQISARVRNYPELFIVNDDVSPKTVDINQVQ